MFNKTSQIRSFILPGAVFGVFILALCIFLPLQRVAFTLPKLMLISWLTAFMLASILFTNTHSDTFAYLKTLPGRFFLAFFAIVALSPLWSAMPIVSIVGNSPRFDGVLAHLVYAGLALSAGHIVQSKRHANYAEWVLIFSNAILVGYGFLQVLRIDPLGFLWNEAVFLGRVFSFVGQPNTLGACILLTFPCIAYRALQSRNMQKSLLSLLSFLNVIVLLATASRAALLGFGGIAIAWIYIDRRALRSVTTSLHWKYRALLAILLCTLVAIGVSAFASRFTLQFEQGRSVGTRQVVWSDAIEMIKQRPMGYGLDALGIVYPRFMSKELHEFESLTATMDRAHSVIFDTLLTLGIAGFVAYYGFVVSLLYLSYIYRDRSPILLPGFLGIVGYGIAMLPGFHTIVSNILFWSIAGIMMGVLCQTTESSMTSLRQSSLYRGVLIILLCASIASGVTYTQWLHQRYALRSAESALHHGDADQGLSMMYQASGSFSYDRVLLVRIAETALSLREDARDKKSAIILDRIATNALDALHDLTGDHDGMTYLLRAWLAAVQGDTDQVDTHIALAKQYMPNSVDTYRIAAHAYGILGDADSVDRSNRELIDVLPSFWLQEGTEQHRILWKENPWLETVRK